MAHLTMTNNDYEHRPVQKIKYQIEVLSERDDEDRFQIPWKRTLFRARSYFSLTSLILSFAYLSVRAKSILQVSPNLWNPGWASYLFFFVEISMYCKCLTMV